MLQRSMIEMAWQHGVLESALGFRFTVVKVMNG